MEQIIIDITGVTIMLFFTIYMIICIIDYNIKLRRFLLISILVLIFLLFLIYIKQKIEVNTINNNNNIIIKWNGKDNTILPDDSIIKIIETKGDTLIIGKINK